jgi:hypothetical protein
MFEDPPEYIVPQKAYTQEYVDAAIEAAVLAERESCAKVCEGYPGTLHQWTDKRKAFAAAIRARGEK